MRRGSCCLIFFLQRSKMGQGSSYIETGKPIRPTNSVQGGESDISGSSHNLTLSFWCIDDHRSRCHRLPASSHSNPSPVEEQPPPRS